MRAAHTEERGRQMSTTVARDGTTQPRETAPVRRPVAPVKIWAAIGLLILAFEFYVLGRWIAGPNFRRVPTGPSTPPTCMRDVLSGWQVSTIPLLVFFFGWFLVRPWLREKRLATDGILCVAFLLLSWQDPFSSYFGNWFTYNSYLFNRGSWVYDIPGWLSYGQPGHELASPLIVFTGLYVYVFLLLSMAGCWLMRTVAARRPQTSSLGLVASCFVVMCVVDLIVEGLIYMPLGFYSYAGGHINLLGAGTYHQVPVSEALTFGMLFTGMASLRFFTNDRGETLAERGASSLHVSGRWPGVLRVLALCGAVQVVMLVTYNIPNAIIVGAHSGRWPHDVQTHSYFNDGICGAGTPRPCPGQGFPLLQPRTGAGSSLSLTNSGAVQMTGPRPTIPQLVRGTGD
jgi:hypothetical protein